MVLSQHIRLFEEFESNVPNHTQTAIEEYLLNGWEPGGFLTAVLTNHLFRSAHMADIANKQSLAVIADWILNHAPTGSFGSQEAIDNWCNDIDGIRTRYTDKLQKEKMWENLSE